MGNKKFWLVDNLIKMSVGFFVTPPLSKWLTILQYGKYSNSFPFGKNEYN